MSSKYSTNWKNVKFKNNSTRVVFNPRDKDEWSEWELKSKGKD